MQTQLIHEAFTILGDGPDNGKTVYGPFRKHLGWLKAMNALGYGVFFTVQGTDGKGRRVENIPSLKCLYGDYDHGKPGGWPLEPTMLVESSPGKFQAYWNFTERTTDFGRWARIMRSLVERTGADPAAQDVARILRVPGFLNTKYTPAVRVEVRSMTAKLYTIEECSKAYGEAAVPARRVAGGQVSEDRLPKPVERAERYFAWLTRVIDAGGWPQTGRNAALFKWACAGVRDFAADPDDVTELLLAVWDRYDHSGDDSRIEEIVARAERSASAPLGCAYAEPSFELLDE